MKSILPYSTIRLIISKRKIRPPICTRDIVLRISLVVGSLYVCFITDGRYASDCRKMVLAISFCLFLWIDIVPISWIELIFVCNRFGFLDNCHLLICSVKWYIFFVMLVLVLVLVYICFIDVIYIFFYCEYFILNCCTRCV